MDDKDGRRSRVPTGTFGGSDPPEFQAPPSQPSGASASDRKRFTSTLTGKDKSAAAEPEAEAEAESEHPYRKRTGNTLVGHPTAPIPNSGAVSPVLSPPKWRGAKAYLEGDEPQPRVSSIPSPPPVPGTPSNPPEGVVIGAMRSKVTTKVGQPPMTQPPTPAIDDTIQRMLEAQASVPMQDDETLDLASIPEIPLDQLPIEMLADSSPRLPKAIVDAVRARDASESAARAAERDAAVQADKPDAAEAPAPASAPVHARAAVPVSKPARSTAERSIEFGFADSSVAPAEVTRRARKDDSHSSLGMVAMAVFALLFVGGWFITRGGFPRPAPKVTVAAPVKPAAEEPSAKLGDPVKATDAPAQAAPANAKANEAADRSATASEESEPAKRSSRRSRADKAGESEPQTDGDERAATESEPSAAPSEPSAVLKVTPSVDPANLPDIPSREDVIAALEPLRKPIGECVGGAHGVAQLDVTVASNGGVSHAIVGGDFAGTKEGSCIARAARSAQFTPFKKPRFRVIYPFSL